MALRCHEELQKKRVICDAIRRSSVLWLCFGNGFFAVGTVPRRFFAGIMASAMFLLLLLLVLSLVPPCILLFPEVPIDYLRLVDRESTARWCRPPGIPLGLGVLSGDTWAWYLRCAV